MLDLFELDGSQGEGGGQILRTALTLSIATGRPFRLKNIRANRRRPGLMRQHLMCVQAAQEISGASTQGADPGSQTLVFEPGPLRPGDYAFHIATAGSTTLVFQTLAPLLLLGKRAFTLEFTGGTHNSAAPCLDFLTQTYLPCLESMGVAWDLVVDRRGYYPAGGGHWKITLTPPTAFTSLEMLRRMPAGRPSARILWARMAPGLAEREKRLLAEGLGIGPEDIAIEEDKTSLGPGNVAIISLRQQPVTETVTLFGGYGAHPGKAAQIAIEEIRAFENHDAPVGYHLADQLPVPLLLAGGGKFRTGSLSAHFQTNAAILRSFVPDCLSITQDSDLTHLVSVSPYLVKYPAAL